MPIDVLAFDACNMADAAVVYQAGRTGLVHYVVASEEEIDEAGFPYDLMLARWSPTRGGRRIAGGIDRDGLRDFYRHAPSACATSLSAVDARPLSRAPRRSSRLEPATAAAGLRAERATYAAALRRASQRRQRRTKSTSATFCAGSRSSRASAARLRVDSERLLADVTRAVVRCAAALGGAVHRPHDLVARQNGLERRGGGLPAGVPLAGDSGWAAFLGAFEK